MKSRCFTRAGVPALAAFILGLCFTASQAAPAGTLFDRVVIIGASASAGYTAMPGPDAPKLEQLRFSRYWDAALLAPHEPVRSLASLLFFLSPEPSARQQLSRALAMQPTLVAGSDFLFWFCYGPVKTNETRAVRLETGLKLLESVPCPLLIGNIPDASGADQDMLPPEYVPTKAEMDAANRRIKQWAAKRRNVVVLNLSNLMLQAAANRALAVHGNKWAAGSTRALLQPDGLHPTPAGCSMLTLAALDAICAAHKQTPATAIRWDAGEIQRLVQTAPAAPDNRRPSAPGAN
jgi:hypothetical protein